MGWRLEKEEEEWREGQPKYRKGGRKGWRRKEGRTKGRQEGRREGGVGIRKEGGGMEGGEIESNRGRERVRV